MMVRNARQNGAGADPFTPMVFECPDLGIELGKRFMDGLGRRAAAGCVERDGCMGRDRPEQCCPRRLGSLADDAFHVAVGEGAVIGIRDGGKISGGRAGRNDDRLAACQQREQGAGERERVVDAQRIAVCAAVRPCRDAGRYMRPEHAARHGRRFVEADRGIVGRIGAQ